MNRGRWRTIKPMATTRLAKTCLRKSFFRSSGFGATGRSQKARPSSSPSRSYAGSALTRRRRNPSPFRRKSVQ
eukprot:7116078-Alexandrium_andersonii.AAC.1